MKSVNQRAGPCVLVQFSMEADSITRACPKNGLFLSFVLFDSAICAKKYQKNCHFCSLCGFKTSFLIASKQTCVSYLGALI